MAATKTIDSKIATGQNGHLIINADDWGRDTHTTNRILECILHSTVSSASAMVFMEDSERAAAIAAESGSDIGLHLNVTTEFSSQKCPQRLRDHQQKVRSYLRQYHPVSRVLFHPLLANSFRYVVKSQCEEFQRLYGRLPQRMDGHHHAHLSSNIIFGGLLPHGIVVRRNHSFATGEKSRVNRCWRSLVDRFVTRWHRTTDMFFSIDPISDLQRLKTIFALARDYVVEVCCHPANDKDFHFLTGDDITRLTNGVEIAKSYIAAQRPHYRI